jgi:hypothetical protein
MMTTKHETLIAAVTLSPQEKRVLQEVLRCYYSEMPWNSEDIDPENPVNLVLESLFQKGLIDTGAKYWSAMAIVPTEMCLTLYHLNRWDLEPRSAESAKIALFIE